MPTRKISTFLVWITVFFLVISSIFYEQTNTQVFSQEETSTLKKLTPLELAIQDLDSAVKSATTQGDLAKKTLGALQNFEYLMGLRPNFIIPPPLINQSDFNKVLDLLEKKWISFPEDDYYDETGVSLLYGNIMAGRFDKADALFINMNSKLVGRRIDQYFDSNSVMETIYREYICKELFTPREDLSLFYAIKMVLEMYEYQEKRDKYCDIIKLMIDSYEDTKGAELLSALYEYTKAELKYGSYESIPKDERKQLTDNKDISIEKMKKICELAVKKVMGE